MIFFLYIAKTPYSEFKQSLNNIPIEAYHSDLFIPII